MYCKLLNIFMYIT